jgi:hypothetical protein
VPVSGIREPRVALRVMAGLLRRGFPLEIRGLPAYSAKDSPNQNVYVTGSGAQSDCIEEAKDRERELRDT